MDEYINKNILLKAINSNVVGEHRSRCAQLLEAILNAPTDDVVPKSEYDAVVSAVDNSTKEFLKLHDDYQKAKREVDRLKYNLKAVLEEIPETKREFASEIFEEIETALKLYKRYDLRSGTYFECYLESDIAELKKKYTEGEE